MTEMPSIDQIRIGIVGLGYVGLPLAVFFARQFPVVGFDLDQNRVRDLQNGLDQTMEVTENDFLAATYLKVSFDPEDMKDVNFFIVTVPTPIDIARQPDMSALRSASAMIGRYLKSGDIVVYESTVYPGATEEVCSPILANVSGLVQNVDFFLGYSPERINPGDHQHRLPDIVKVTSGSTPAAALLIDSVYTRIITAGTYRAASIKIAEAAKVIENIQRDVNIALINELAQLFKLLGLETREVLAASSTKWNFHNYKPGLVGGHCIGVDPYYLTYKAQSIGFHPEMILAGRRINDRMSRWLAMDLVECMVKAEIEITRAHVLVCGFTFKENCPDIRNTKVADLVGELAKLVRSVVVYDPLVQPNDAMMKYGIEVLSDVPKKKKFDAIVLAVKHSRFSEANASELRSLLNADGIIYDLKEVLPTSYSDFRI